MIAIALVLMLCVSALSISAFAAGTVKVTAEVPAEWTAPYCYGWVDGTTNSHWPGVLMTKSGSEWVAEIPANCNRVIINNGQGGGTNQTADLTIEAGKDVKVVVTKSGSTISASVNGVEPAPAPTPSGYYVTGSGDVFSNWTECNTNGKMTESNGIYVKEFTGVAAGDYSIKVNDGTWANSWGGNGENGNYDFNVAEANSTVTVKFNPADNTVTVEVNGNSTGDPDPVPQPEFNAYYVAGTAALCNGKEWDAGAAENIMTKGEDGIWSITYTNVAAGDYELKVTAGNWDNSWGLRGENVKFTLEEEAAEITVKFNPATGWVSVYNGENPLTNDVSLAGIGIALLAATAGVVALVGKKKEF